MHRCKKSVKRVRTATGLFRIFSIRVPEDVHLAILAAKRARPEASKNGLIVAALRKEYLASTPLGSSQTLPSAAGARGTALVGVPGAGEGSSGAQVPNRGE